MAERLIVSADAPADEVVERAALILRQGGVVAIPTDTLYALAADATSATAVARVFAIKGRNAERALPVIAADEAQVSGLVGELGSLGRRLARQFWPGPLSLVIRARGTLAPAVHGGVGTVAVRVPASPLARALARAAGVPLTATSANASGEHPALTAQDVERSLGSIVDLILDGGPSAGRVPSTLVDVTGAHPLLLRDGAVPWACVLESV